MTATQDVCAVVSATCLVILVAFRQSETDRPIRQLTPASDVAPRVASAPRSVSAVFPASAATAPVVDLPDLLVSLLPDEGFSQIAWTFAASNPRIVWQTNGVSADGSSTVRVGYVRVRVAGKTLTVLRQTVEELAWSVALRTTESKKFGPRTIEVSPSVASPEGQCFGTLFEGCSFKPTDALRSAALAVRSICESGSFGDHKEAYAVAANGKKESLVVFTSSVGSGGETTSIKIAPMSNSPDVCRA